MYNILEARIEYRNKKLHRVIVLVEISKGDVRAIYSTDSFKNGYDSLSPDEPVNDALLQRVAGYGIQTVDRDIIFPHWKAKQTPGTSRKVKQQSDGKSATGGKVSYDEWKKELIQVTARATGQSEKSIKISEPDAKMWYNDGFTPYQCFRETWDMEDDVGL
jgi:hypothetical protein